MRATILLQAVLLFVASLALADDPPEFIPGLPTPMPSPSPDPFVLEEVVRRIAATRHLAVPIPKKTPYDADRVARRVYIKAYRAGYRQTAAGYMSDLCLTANTPYRKAVEDGFGDGQHAAVKKGLWIK